ncbi:uncharacterized protein LOC120425373 [Culex pipiens pallens]|uniref:uncharacterized protein LOC120425373 n=1 Tax=Culex pipiens pallens TaxID=42434 RepID=UPI001953B895|nr:uncharacterized protein LOC120425373 [Culex pipiens pallens]
MARVSRVAAIADLHHFCQQCPSVSSASKMSFLSRSFMPPFFLFRGESSYSAMGSRQQQQSAGGDQQSLRSSSLIGEEDIPRIRFEPLNTSLVVWIQMVCSLVLTGTGLVYGYYGCFINDGCNGYYIMLLGRAGLWMATYCVHLYVKKSHNRLKILGYHRFLRWTHRNKKLPLQLVSFCNLIILTMHTIFLEYFGAHFFIDCHIKRFPMILALSIICVLECIFLILTHFAYLVKVNVFNSQRYPPDAMLTGENRRNSMAPEEFLSQQFLLVVKLMDENRHILDKIREARSTAEVINSESTHLSQVEQSMIGA